MSSNWTMTPGEWARVCIGVPVALTLVVVLWGLAAALEPEPAARAVVEPPR